MSDWRRCKGVSEIKDGSSIRYFEFPPFCRGVKFATIVPFENCGSAVVA